MVISSRGLQIVILAMGLVLGGCGTRTIDIDSVGLSTHAVETFSYTDWGLTLSRAVEGYRVNYGKASAFSPSLDRFLAMVAEIGPTTHPELFPTRESRMAFLINCYNATILRAVVAARSDGLNPWATHADFDSAYRFRVDGSLQTPGGLRRSLLNETGLDWRVRFALCNGRAGDPPLPRRPILPELLDAHLNEITRTALTLPQIVSIDYGERKRLLVWRGLYAIRVQLVADYEKRLNARTATLLNVLLEWAGAERRIDLNGAVGYEVAPLPYDNRINDSERPDQKSGGV